MHEAHDKMPPGGRWVSCEFFRAQDSRINRVFHDLAVSFIHSALKNGDVSSEQLDQLGSSSILRREHHICTVDKKVQWLKECGFVNVDVPWRFLNLAIITGTHE